MFAALLKTTLLTSPPVVLIVGTSILKAFKMPYEVVFGYKNSNKAMVSRPYVWLESPNGEITDFGFTTHTDKISVCGVGIGFVTDAQDVTYTTDVTGPIYKVPDNGGTLESLRKLVKQIQSNGLNAFMKKLDDTQQAAITDALALANDPASRITFGGMAEELREYV